MAARGAARGGPAGGKRPSQSQGAWRSPGDLQACPFLALSGEDRGGAGRPAG